MELMKNFVLAAAQTDAAQTPPPDWMVVVMGVGVVFIGLVLIIVICKIMGLFFVGDSQSKETPVVAKPTAAVNNTVIENRQEIIAAVTAACAEDMGKDVSAIRVISFKKI
ncbi:MAG: OadG family transporter subunit [Clostridia bacterium]|nr:OadG family transporter subunit [Clostridia bacterium]